MLFMILLEAYLFIKKAMKQTYNHIKEDQDIFPLTTLLNKAQSEEWCIRGEKIDIESVVFREDDRTELELIKEDQVNMEAILKLSEEAFFGSETIHDPNVRSACFIPGDLLEVKLYMPCCLPKFTPL